MGVASRSSHLYDSFLRKIPRQSRSRSVVEAILVATIDRLQRDGDETPSLEAIAARAGVGIGSLYDYFSDRQGLLAGLVAKITEDNLQAFERLLRASHDLPLEEAVSSIVDHVLATYVADPKLARFALRMAYQLGLVPTLAETQTVFARSLATALAARTDLGPPRDYSATAYVLTHAMMGIVHTQLWEDPSGARAGAPTSPETIRAEIVTMVLHTIRRG
jgi:AcrR family transcriptional regulator